MANFNDIKHEIDQNVNTNGVQAITGAILNETLKDMIDEVDEKKQDTLVAGQNITIQGNVISATGGGGGQTLVAGDGINITNDVISVDPYDLDGNGLFVDAEGDLSVNPSDIAGTGLTDEGGGYLAVDTSTIQEKLTPGSSINIDSNNKIDIDSTAIAGTGLIGTLSYGTNPILEIDPSLAGDGLSWNSNGAFDVDTTTIQPKLTAGSGISISAQNVISATGGGGGGTTYGDGDAIHIDSNDNINVLYGSGLQLDGNGNLEVDSSVFSGYYLPLEGGILQDPSNTDTLLEIQSPNGNAEVEIVASEVESPDATAYVEVRDTNGDTIYGSDGITLGGVGGDKLNFPSGPATLATDADLSSYLRNDASGQIQNFLDGTGDTELKIVDGYDEDYVKLGAYDTPGEAPHIEIFENGSGDTKFFYDHLERGSQVSIDYPSSSGTLALIDDIPTPGAGLQVSVGNEIYVDTTQIQEKLTAGANIQINGSTISATDTNTTYSAGSGLNLNGTTFSVNTNSIQEKLTAGSNITITNNVISATGGSGATYSAGNGINIDQNNEISVDSSDLAGSGLMVDQNGALAVIGGGGSGLWTSGTGTNSLMTPAAAAGTATASGTGSISMGNASQASGNYSIASGSATASGDHAIALGAGTANGYYSIMLGTMTTQGVGDQSVALNAKAANAHYSIAGPQADASGVNTTVGNVAFGYDATASPQSYTTAIGHGARAQYEGTTAIGNFNEYYGQNSGSASLFAIGNGTSDNARSNALEIRKSDNAVYIDGIGAYSGDSRTPGVKSLQSVLSGKQDLLTAGSGISIQNNVISTTGGGSGTSFTPGDALELDQNDNLNVLYGSGLTLNGNNELEVDPSSITGFLPSVGGTLQGEQGDTSTTLSIQSPNGYSSIDFTADDDYDGNGNSRSEIAIGDSNGSIQIGTDGISDGTYTTSWPSPSADTTFATLEDVSGFLPLTGGTLQQTNGDPETFLSVFSDDSSHEACVYASDTNANVGLFNYPSNPQEGDIDNISFLSDGTITIADWIEDPQNPGSLILDEKVLQLPVKNDTIATLSDIQGGSQILVAGDGIDITNDVVSVDTNYLDGEYLPLTGGVLQNTSLSTGLVINSPNSQNHVSMSALDSGTVEVEIGMSTSQTVQNPSDGDIKNVRIYKDRLDLYNYDSSQSTWRADSFYFPKKKTGTLALTSDLAGKQDTLVSGTNIKTVNGNSLLGSGNLVISGGGSYVAGNGIDITSGTISVDETYLDSVYLPILGGTLENTANHTDLKIAAPHNESTAYADIMVNGTTGTPYLELFSETSVGTDAESFKINGLGNFELGYVNGTSDVIELPHKAGTIALLSDISGGGTSYTAGAGINIDANNVISNSAPDPGLWVAGTGTDSIKAFNAYSASGTDSVAIGYNSRATANNAVAVGPNANAASHDAVSVGGYVSAPYSIAGPGASITGGLSGYGVAFGYNAQVDNNYGVAIGYGAYSKVSGEYTIGDYNKYYNSNNTNEKVLFSVGNGSGSLNRANALEFKQNNDLYVYGVGSFDGTNAANASTLQTVLNGKQDTLTAGSGISISGNVISATGGGGGGSSLWTNGTGTDSLVAPATVNSSLSLDPAAGDGAISCGYDTNADGDFAFACGAASGASGDYSFAANNGNAYGEYSAAFSAAGAYGMNSFAAGGGAIAGPDYSVALGGGNVIFDEETDPQNPINAQYGVAIGEASVVEGEYGLAFMGGTASGSHSVAIGDTASASEMYSTALTGSSANGNYSFAASTGAASGHYSSALSGGTANGEGSLASGFATSAYGFCSAALGYSLSTYDQADGTSDSDPNAGEVALGRYNYSEADIIFTVGCGYIDNTDPDNPEEVRENAVAIDSSGNIFIKGIGGYTGQTISGATSLQDFLNNL